MKKLIVAAAMCLGTAAFAQSATGTPSNPAPGAPSSQQIKGPTTGVEAQEVGPAIGDTAKKVVGADKDKSAKEAGAWKMKDAYSLSGTVKSPDGDDVTIARTGDLPAVELDVRDQTVVTLDGKTVKASELPEGASVRAKFQLDGDDTVALELKATSPKGAVKK
ncbi:hypothetical protein D7Y13_14270 [Corallococcus praedator]|uniref:DUF5666 domain-containing protein n=1 Tax=Corallococcus praedator TaxID=2316724 RepID=A0ABX9QIQ7_9BACT|nr:MULTISPECIES: hypothetical protein [Corallococcus]RKH17626.1 hypothetical protein D7X74_11930 [Corallococcus sp. CA047B]RKH31624.1 hypothetical protein D7X75_18870 [Corallococcus sp. CA031C]RKI09500.1 hypothetical protein D7Y13_14270 [Corallococcus praedator]